MSMTSIERVEAVLDHKIPDRHSEVISSRERSLVSEYTNKKTRLSAMCTSLPVMYYLKESVYIQV